jgi:hypothetical protein
LSLLMLKFGTYLNTKRLIVQDLKISIKNETRGKLSQVVNQIQQGTRGVDRIIGNCQRGRRIESSPPQIPPFCILEGGGGAGGSVLIQHHVYTSARKVLCNGCVLIHDCIVNYALANIGSVLSTLLTVCWSWRGTFSLCWSPSSLTTRLSVPFTNPAIISSSLSASMRIGSGSVK